MTSRSARVAAGGPGARRGHPREFSRGSFLINDLPVPAGRRIALIAHDNKKQDMLEWAEYNLALLAEHQLFATAGGVSYASAPGYMIAYKAP